MQAPKAVIDFTWLIQHLILSTLSRVAHAQLHSGQVFLIQAAPVHLPCLGCAPEAVTSNWHSLTFLQMSRFNTSVQFGLPDEACRAQILQQYAKHLKEEDLATLAQITPGLAGRDLKDLSEQAERRWASKVTPMHSAVVVYWYSHVYWYSQPFKADQQTWHLRLCNDLAQKLRWSQCCAVHPCSICYYYTQVSSITFFCRLHETALFIDFLTRSILHLRNYGNLQIIRSVVPKDQYEPPVDEYIAAAHQRVKEKQVKKTLPFQLL